MTILIIIIVLLLLSITIVSIVKSGVFSKSIDNEIKSVDVPLKIPFTYPIDPAPFKTGYIKNLPPRQKISDYCNSKMYPVEPLYVDYGSSFSTGVENTKYSDVNIFNSSH
jgi:hypothetical protein